MADQAVPDNGHCGLRLQAGHDRGLPIRWPEGVRA